MRQVVTMLCYAKRNKFLEQLGTCQVLKKQSDLYSYVYYIYPPIICNTEGNETNLLLIYFSYFCSSSSPLNSLPLLQHPSTY